MPVESIQAFSRNEWIDANIPNFKLLFAPIEGMYQRVAVDHQPGHALMGDVNQTWSAPNWACCWATWRGACWGSTT